MSTKLVFASKGEKSEKEVFKKKMEIEMIGKIILQPSQRNISSSKTIQYGRYSTNTNPTLGEIAS